jgi:hypothetical protein
VQLFDLVTLTDLLAALAQRPARSSSDPIHWLSTSRGRGAGVSPLRGYCARRRLPCTEICRR